MRNLAIVKDSSKLRQMILDNPDLPIVVLAGDCASDGDHSWTYCSKVNVGIENQDRLSWPPPRLSPPLNSSPVP